MAESPAWAMAEYEKATTPVFETAEAREAREQKRERESLNRRIRNRLETPA